MAASSTATVADVPVPQPERDATVRELLEQLRIAWRSCGAKVEDVNQETKR